MKAVMYHYIRCGKTENEYFRYLPFEQFVRQLDWFEENGGFITQQQFYQYLSNPCIADELNGFLLSFDDGLSEHYSKVFPELQRRGLWGIFFIPTNVLQIEALLPVHAVHYLLGKFGAKVVCNAMREILTYDPLDLLPDMAYGGQYSSDRNEKACKYVVNYYLDAEQSRHCTDSLLQYFDIDQVAVFKKWYLQAEQLKEMVQNHMVVGAHSCRHALLSRLPVIQMKEEITQSIETISAITGIKQIPFCFPYGGADSYNKTVLNELHRLDCPYAFDVSSKDISSSSSRLFLPRYDCNEFPWGESTVGPN